jgi:hypothetical protein
MPIRPYLAGRTFAPEIISAISAALEEACKSLNIEIDSASRAMVAQTIILLVEEGVTSADQFTTVVVKEMRGTQHR